jgi:predicted dehydrogenase
VNLGVGVIGLGVGEQHARAFAAALDCTVVALCDRDDAKLQAVGASMQGARLYSRAEDLIDDPSVRVVSVASNDDDHYAHILRALVAGKHVFAEKPLCLEPDQLAAIRAAWRRAPGARLSTNTVLRRSPRFRWIKDAVASGRLGRVFCVEADYVYGRLHKLTDGWRGCIPGYSVMLGGGVHLVDLILWITGERPVEVTAVRSGLASRGTAFSGHDLMLALLRFESGLVAKVGANFASVYPHFHRFLVYGTEATFETAPDAISPAARLWTSRDAAVAPLAVDAPYASMGKGELIPAFVEALHGRGEPDVTEEEAFGAVAVCLAIDQAARDGGAVTVTYS